MPIFRKGPGPYALAVAMSGIRMGERLLWIGAQEAAMFGAVAKKVGLSGRAAAVVDSEAGAGRIRDAAARAGVLVDLETAAAEHLPFDADSFDIVVIAGPVGLVEGLAPDAQLAVLTEARRVLRPGGRMLVVERFAHRRLFGLMAPGDRADLTGQQAEAALQAAGFRPVRTLARREGLLFIEGLKRGE
jgi:ubiquinone/menaquinone biosynthesis C-methylase UbiE